MILVEELTIFLLFFSSLLVPIFFFQFYLILLQVLPQLNTNINSPQICSQNLLCICKFSCSLGTFQDDDIDTDTISIYNITCKQCPAGYYQDQELADDCKSCSSGLYQDELTQSSCKDCIAGKYHEQLSQTNSTSCLSCPEGSYSSKTGNILTDCKTDCKAGNYINLAQTQCLDCPKGQYQNENQKHSCKIDCRAGHYILNAATCR